MIVDNASQSGEPAQLSDRLRTMIEVGAEIAGGAAGGALGFLASGPGGAAVFGAGGVVAAKTLARAGSEIASRMLGNREEARIGAVLAMAADEARERIENGETPRTDEFFDPGSTGRSPADSVTEAALLKAQREAEEKKLPYIANLLAHSAFDPGYTAPLVHQILKISDALTYRQFVLLALAHSTLTQIMRQTSFRDEPQPSTPEVELIYEYFDLNMRGLITNGETLAISVIDINPGHVRLQGVGHLMYSSMKLDRIHSDEMLQQALILKSIGIADAPET